MHLASAACRLLARPTEHAQAATLQTQALPLCCYQRPEASTLHSRSVLYCTLPAIQLLSRSDDAGFSTGIEDCHAALHTLLQSLAAGSPQVRRTWILPKLLSGARFCLAVTVSPCNS